MVLLPVKGKVGTPFVTQSVVGWHIPFESPGFAGLQMKPSLQQEIGLGSLDGRTVQPLW